MDLIRLFWGWVFPSTYISRIHTAYIAEDSSMGGRNLPLNQQPQNAHRIAGESHSIPTPPPHWPCSARSWPRNSRFASDWRGFGCAKPRGFFGCVVYISNVYTERRANHKLKDLCDTQSNPWPNKKIKKNTYWISSILGVKQLEVMHLRLKFGIITSEV